MRFSIALTLLASTALSSAATIDKRGFIDDVLSKTGCLHGQNSITNNGAAWIGNDGAYIVEFTNNSGENLVLVLWGSGPQSPFVIAQAPLITYELKPGDNLNVSVASNTHGAWAALYADTTLQNGMVSNTWGEYAFDGQSFMFDVSRVVNMNGRAMSIEGAQCVANMDKCVFVCRSGDSCSSQGAAAILKDCSSQPGAQSAYDAFMSTWSGGCLVGAQNFVKATFS